MDMTKFNAMVIGLGPKGARVAEAEDRRIIHLQGGSHRNSPGIGDRVLCEGIISCEGDATAKKYRLVARADHSDVLGTKTGFRL